MTIDFSLVSFWLALAALVISIPLFVLLVQSHEAPRMLAFTIVMLCVGAVIGAFGRVAGPGSTSVDHWVRILVIATRVAVLGAMLYDIRWLWRHRHRRG